MIVLNCGNSATKAEDLNRRPCGETLDALNRVNSTGTSFLQDQLEHALAINLKIIF